MLTGIWNYYIECNADVAKQLSDAGAAYVKQIRPDGTYVLCGEGTGLQITLVVT